MITSIIKYRNMNYFSRKRELEKYAQLGKVSHELFHDILNPITGLVLYFDIIKNSRENNFSKYSEIESELHNDIEELSDSGERIRRFIQLIQSNLLNQSGSDLIDVHKEIKEIISLNYPKAKRNSVSIYFIQNEKVEIRIPKIKFYQIISNLISNGIDSFEKNNDNRKRKLVIKCEKIKDKIILSVSDNGCGIQKKNLNKIFKDNYSNKDYGLGIGLKTVKKIDSEHKGKIELESLINKGTTFKIYLPKSH